MEFVAIAIVVFIWWLWAIGRATRRSRTVRPYAIETTKTKARSAAELKPLLETLPEVKVFHVIDGDTLIVGQKSKRWRVRLDSIDSPEDGQDWGDMAKYGLIKLVGGKVVRIEVHGSDHHGRTLASLFVRNQTDDDWIWVNERMIMLGHAWVMRKYDDHLPPDRQAALNRLEAWAKSKKVGLWRAENPVPPWLWRR